MRKRWKYFVKPGRPQMTIRRMLLACSTTKATETRSEYVTLIALPLQKCLYGAPQYNVIRTLPVVFIKQCSILLMKFLNIITEIRRLTVYFTTICPNLHRTSFFFVSVTNFAISLTNKFLLPHIFT